MTTFDAVALDAYDPTVVGRVPVRGLLNRINTLSVLMFPQEIQHYTSETYSRMFIEFIVSGSSPHIINTGDTHGSGWTRRPRFEIRIPPQEDDTAVLLFTAGCTLARGPVPTRLFARLE